MDKDKSLPTKNVVTEGNYFSVAQLVALRLPGKPKTPKGWYDLVERENWSFIEVQGKGGSKGVRREYLPPPDVLALIEKVQRGELEPASPSTPAPSAPSDNVVQLRDNAPTEGKRDNADDTRKSSMKRVALAFALEGVLMQIPEADTRTKATKAAEFCAMIAEQGMFPMGGFSLKALGGVNVVALSFALEGVLQQMPGADNREIAQNAAYFYTQLEERGLITPGAAGKGNEPDAV